MYVEDDENLDALLLLFIKYIYFVVALCLSSKLFSQKRKEKITTLRYINEAKNILIYL